MDPAALYTRVRRRLDLDESEVHLDLEIGQLAEESYFELWDLLIATMGDEAPWERRIFTTVAGQDYIDIDLVAQNGGGGAPSWPFEGLPGVYRMVRWDFRGSGQVWYPLQRFALGAEPLDEQPRPWTEGSTIRYFARRNLRPTFAERAAFAGALGAFSGWRVYFNPVPAGEYSVRLHYVPPPRIGLSDADPEAPYSVFPDEFPEYVVADVCAKLRVKEEADPTEFERERERIRTRIEAYYKPHQLNAPQFVHDHRRLQQHESVADIEAFWRR